MNEILRIRSMTESDFEFADSLRAIVNWNQTVEDWKRLLTLNPTGCFVAECNKTMAGTATTTRYGTDLAWIGMLLVHPEYRRKGIARTLLKTCVDHLSDVRCIKLDATPLGKPLYDQLKFHDEWALSRWELNGSPPEHSPSSHDGDFTARSLTQSDIESISTYDKQTFGVMRRELLESFLSSESIAYAEYIDSETPVGYAIVREGTRASYLGPIVADSVEIAERLVLGLAPRLSRKLIFWDIPDINSAATDLAKRMGFRKQRPLMRMYRGVNSFPGVPSKYFGIIDPSLG